MKWQPIETAPKDGTEILACAKDPTVPNRWFYGVTEWAFADDAFPRTVDGWFWNYATIPTHWMPMPEPPEMTK